MSQRWQVYAVGEGLAKTASGLFQKFIGVALANASGGLLAYLVVGTFQFFSGFLGFTRNARKNPSRISELVPDVRSVLWSCAFGFFATLMTVVGIVTFLMGADLGVRTLLVVCSIIPGAILGRMIFGDSLNFRQVLGILVFLGAVWAMLDFPNADALKDLPSWVWLTLVVTFSAAINEVLSRKASVKLDAWVNNFWVGGSTMFFCILGLVVYGVSGISPTNITNAFWFGAVVLGGITTAMIAFKLLAYKGGGTIALKKIIMQGTYLGTVTFAGVLFYSEALTLGKLAGLGLWLVAFVLTDNGTWKIIFSRKEKESAQEA